MGRPGDATKGVAGLVDVPSVFRGASRDLLAGKQSVELYVVLACLDWDRPYIWRPRHVGPAWGREVVQALVADVAVIPQAVIAKYSFPPHKCLAVSCREAVAGFD